MSPEILRSEILRFSCFKGCLLILLLGDLRQSSDTAHPPSPPTHTQFFAFRLIFTVIGDKCSEKRQAVGVCNRGNYVHCVVRTVRV